LGSKQAKNGKYVHGGNGISSANKKFFRILNNFFITQEKNNS
jgi:hypothetical protein